MRSIRFPRISTGWLIAAALCLGLLVPVIGTAGPDEHWVSDDIGEAEPAGSFAVAGNEYVVRGAGEGISGTSDGFHYARQPIVGDAVIVANVEDLSAGSEQAHAGVMIRDGDAPDAAHASLVVVDGQVALRYRDVAGASPVEITYRPPPGWRSSFWLRMERKGSTFTAEISNNGRGWRDVGSVHLTLNETALVGLAASNAENGDLATAKFSDVVVEGQRPEPEEEPEPDSSPEPDPEPTDDPDPVETSGEDSDSFLSGEDIGSPTPDGSTVEDDGTFTVEGAGTDIYDRSDSFHYAWKEVTGDLEIIARVTSQTDTGTWAKAGIMLRNGLDADARHASVFVTPSSGTVLVHRPETGGDSYHVRDADAVGPQWVRIQRVDGTIVGAVSADGSNWTEIGRLSLSLPDTLHVGLAVTSTEDGTLSTATFTDLQITTIEATEATEATDEQLEEQSTVTTSGDRLGLHVTAEELDYWRQRWASGTGDAFLDERLDEEKDRVVSNKNTFMNDPSAHLMRFDDLPLDSDGCISGSGRNFSTQRAQAARMRDAAFYGLVTENTTVLNQVKKVLVKQPTEPSANFGDDKPWCSLTQQLLDSAGPYFATTHAIITSLFTYDYLQVAIDQGLISDFSSAQSATLDRWYHDWAYKLSPSAHYKMRNAFEDWDNDDYTLKGVFADPDGLIHWTSPNTYQGGPQIHYLHNLWNNRRASTVRYLAVAGVKFNDDYLTWFSKKWLRDYIRYHTFPHGALGDMHRGWSSASAGLGYMSLSTAHALTGVDTLARAGDTSLYGVSTTIGAHGTEGKPHHGSLDAKSYQFVMQTLTRYSNRTFDRYNGSDERYDFRDPNRGFHDRLIVGNLYYQDSAVADFYRGHNGMHPWKVTINGSSDLNDAWAYPAPYLMWAGLEGKVWPYPQP